jgi:ABC-type glutathione transport system ATPase component
MQATRGIDVDVALCERVGIVGESGCGNSITGLSILRLLPTNLAGLDGSIMVDGVDLASCNTAAMRDVCVRAGNPGGFAGVQRGRRILTHRARSDHKGSLMAGRILS